MKNTMLAGFTGYEWYMILVYVLIAAAIGFTLFLVFRPSKAQKKKEQEARESQTFVEKTNIIAELFGGKDNVKSIEIKGSRVVVNCKSTKSIEPKKLDEQGLKGSIITASSVTFPVGSKAEEFAVDLKNKIDGIKED